MKPIVLSTAYFPCIEYMAYLLHTEKAIIDIHEHYIKQTYRNRCIILSANGLINLSIPVIKTMGGHTPVHHIRISYRENWQQNHLRAIASAYNKSAYFLFYQDAIEKLLSNRYEWLFELNTAISALFKELLGFEWETENSDAYIKEDDGINDLRDHFSAKGKKKMIPEYPQVFSDRFSFQPNLCFLDLLFNKGPEASLYLRDFFKDS